eukprot:TRINITY_DN1025_c0_g1_i3.p1 TRINITY_DN1025_c0_g1~~TRINITY_DN1025_c0_g1_i3.p1  ORF type:complete len:662 (-),score=276.66 TRINITY_DN1025_c0_g1_i3:151-2052(-)
MTYQTPKKQSASRSNKKEDNALRSHITSIRNLLPEQSTQFSDEDLEELLLQKNSDPNEVANDILLGFVSGSARGNWETVSKKKTKGDSRGSDDRNRVPGGAYKSNYHSSGPSGTSSQPRGAGTRREYIERPRKPRSLVEAKPAEATPTQTTTDLVETTTAAAVQTPVATSSVKTASTSTPSSTTAPAAASAPAPSSSSASPLKSWASVAAASTIKEEPPVPTPVPAPALVSTTPSSSSPSSKSQAQSASSAASELNDALTAPVRSEPVDASPALPKTKTQSPAKTTQQWRPKDPKPEPTETFLQTTQQAPEPQQQQTQQQTQQQVQQPQQHLQTLSNSSPIVVPQQQQQQQQLPTEPLNLSSFDFILPASVTLPDFLSNVDNSLSFDGSIASNDTLTTQQALASQQTQQQVQQQAQQQAQQQQQQQVQQQQQAQQQQAQQAQQQAQQAQHVQQMQPDQQMHQFHPQQIAQMRMQNPYQQQPQHLNYHEQEMAFHPHYVPYIPYISVDGNDASRQFPHSDNPGAQPIPQVSPFYPYMHPLVYPYGYKFPYPQAQGFEEGDFQRGYPPQHPTYYDPNAHHPKNPQQGGVPKQMAGPKPQNFPPGPQSAPPGVNDPAYAFNRAGAPSYPGFPFNQY